MQNTVAKQKFMKMDDIMQAILMLAQSQGFYGRLYNALCLLKSQQPQQFEQLTAELEQQKFTDVVDMVLYFES